MKIVLSEGAGFCFGVKRAVDMAFEAADRRSLPSCGCIYSFGPIIHNPQVVESLGEKGVKVIDNIENVSCLEDCTVIFRSHGVPEPELMTLLKARGVNVVDATCPYVKKAQVYAKRLVDEGYSLVIVGDRRHPEIESILGHCGKRALVTEDVSDIKHLKNKNRIGIISQTTQTHDNFRAVVSEVALWVEDLKVLNTICGATRVRQEEALKVARTVDMMIVIGGRNSANTTKLANVCREVNRNTVQIETEAEIELSWFEDGSVRSVGVTGGASTPEWMIKRTVDVLQNLSENRCSKY